MKFRKSDKQTQAYFQKKEQTVRIHHKEFNGPSIRYIETGRTPAPDVPLVLFVHGAPGSSDNYFDYLSDSLLQQKATLVAPDRLGYGFSAYGAAVTSLVEQTELIEFVANQYNTNSIIPVGYSYGGPIAGKFLINKPERIKKLVLIAPVNDPHSEKVFWFAYFGHWKLTRWILSKTLRVAADEKFAHIEELKKIESQWASIQKPVVHIHGDKDRLAYFENLAFSQQHISDSLLTVDVVSGGGHMILWTQQERIKQHLYSALDE